MSLREIWGFFRGLHHENPQRYTLNPCMLRTRTRSLFGGHLNRPRPVPVFSGKRHLNRPAKPGYQHPLRGLNLQTLNLHRGAACRRRWAQFSSEGLHGTAKPASKTNKVHFLNAGAEGLVSTGPMKIGPLNHSVSTSACSVPRFPGSSLTITYSSARWPAR